MNSILSDIVALYYKTSVRIRTTVNKNTLGVYNRGYVDALFDLCSALDIINLDLDSAPMPCSIL